MSGRSAYVRKKITQTKDGSQVGDKGSSSGSAGRGRSKSSSTAISSSDDGATIHEFPLPGRPDTAVGATNARLLKFAEPIRENELMNFRPGELPGYASQSGESQSSGSNDGHRDTSASSQFKGPLQDFAYARARRPVIKTEEVSGIEKSGFRSALDKKTEEVRKGIAKTFAFRKKDKGAADGDRTGLDYRPPSSATVRPHGAPPLAHDDFDDCGSPFSNEPNSPMPPQGQYGDQPQPPWECNSSAPTSPQQPNLVRSPVFPPSSSLPPIKRWTGGGRPVQRWNKLRKDPELWDMDGDVLVFFGHKGQQPRPNPSFRLSSHIIEATESRYLIMLLREGFTDGEDLSVAGPASMMAHRHASRAESSLSGQSGGRSAPVMSEDGGADGQISYELYFPSPPNLTRIDQLRYHITTRNVFALLYHASLVGLSLYQALGDLHARLETYMSTETDNLGAIVQYLAARAIDDVRNDVEGAVSLLAWSESADVRWAEGWREFFLHCAGMYPRVELCADFKNVSPITRALLERASLETQLRVQAAEERLAEFQYGDMWPSAVATVASTSGPVAPSPAKAAADRLQKFFVGYYSRVYGRWPPLPPPPANGMPGVAVGDPDDEMWLTRTVAQNLQKDFSALYDYLVDRDIIWDGSEARAGRKWMLVSSSGNRGFEADSEDLPMTDMLIEFDNRLRFPHIPRPYPLVPESIPPPPAAAAVAAAAAARNGNGKEKSGKKSSNNGSGTTTPTSGRNAVVERKVALAYTEATNIMLLGSDFVQSDLIDAFLKFEKSDRVGEVDPSTARRGRWTLIYGILQTLASVSVDAPNMRYREDVAYHLSPRLKGAKVPPWKKGSGGAPQEAGHELSYCWLAPRIWAAAAASSGAESSAAESGGSGNNSPVHHGGGFPSLSTKIKSGGGQTGGTRSPWSAGSAAMSMSSYLPALSSTASVMSDSDAGSSVLTPVSSGSRMGRTGGFMKSAGRWYEPGNGPGTIDTVNEIDWPVAHRRDQWGQVTQQQHQMQLRQMQPPQQQNETAGRRDQSGRRHRSGSRGRGDAEKSPAGIPATATGGFLVLDDLPDDGASYTAGPTGRGPDKGVLGTSRGGTPSSIQGRSDQGLPQRRTAQSADRASRHMMIRDFDDLDEGLNDLPSPVR
ncbi:hypothetical protein MAPG_07666 [Magnaporthiopsis poae ATCC 64411]|uniref:DUF8004 domain-containing protein n=1 Tax=Magnaporthiopsis poae (strain ATCC 64411 / 73-15) TaxID=644358 RepID=A0A0C4E5A0_MAGP6|nr:hypothetical protein MAPG_07666 [Magnaporthiopsis poae ATCC 64411]